jgi:hypothetical protein
VHNEHEPDPKFLERLEWQLGSELRRSRKAGGAPRRGIRVLKTVGLVIGSIALGAAGMGASQQLSEAWRKELLETRLEVQLQLAQTRLQTQLEIVGRTREQVEQGLREERELAYLELLIAQAEATVKTSELELEEVRSSGREPLDDLSAPLVDGRDFVSERLRVRMGPARQHLDVVRPEADRTRQRVEAGVVHEQELQAPSLAALEAELQLDALARQLELRRAYLESEISAVEAELQLLEVEARNRVTLLRQQLEYYQRDLDRFARAVGLDTSDAVAATQLRARVTEVEGQLRLAQAEQEIVRRELRRREEGAQ